MSNGDPNTFVYLLIDNGMLDVAVDRLPFRAQPDAVDVTADPRVPFPRRAAIPRVLPFEPVDQPVGMDALVMHFVPVQRRRERGGADGFTRLVRMFRVFVGPFVLRVRSVVRVLRMLRDRTRRQGHQHRHADRGSDTPADVRAHSRTSTSRIIPDSRWYSRWQWYAQRPSASARTR